MKTTIYLLTTGDLAVLVMNPSIDGATRKYAQESLLKRINEVPLDWSGFTEVQRIAVKKAVHFSLDFDILF